MRPTTKTVDVDVEMELRAAWCLARARFPRVKERAELVEELGSARAALAALEPPMPPSARLAAEKSLDRTRARGFRVLALTDPCYPRLLSHIPDPPLTLTMWGRLEPEDAVGLSVVGSRRATPYGLAAAHRLAKGLSAAGLTIVSGLARGIDAAAHRGALEAGGRTVAVLGSGLEKLYPREHRSLAEAVAERGAVLSEFELDEPPRRENFPRRNRIITGLSLGTLVVEAAPRSGSLVSARHALEQDREVFAVPGPIGVDTSAGVHDLIRDGARLVSSAEDLIEDLPDAVRQTLVPPRERAPSSALRPSEPEDGDERAVLSTLARAAERALDVDDILAGVGVSLSIDRVLSALSRLELRKRVRRHPGGFFRAE